MDIREEYIKEFREQQQKYVYYLLAISIAAIGFSVNITMERTLVSIDIALGCSMLLWLISSLYGLFAVQNLVSAIAANVSIIDISSGNHELTRNHPQAIQFGLKTMNGVLERMSNKSIKLMSRQRTALYLGIFTFVIWRLLDMLPAPTINNLMNWIN